MSANDLSLSKQESAAKKEEDEKMDVDEEKKKDEEEKKDEEKKEEQPTEATLKNPCRVVKQQEESMQYLKDEKSRYWPVLDTRFSGFVVL